MPNQMPSSILEALRRLAPGTALRDGIERIIQQRTGALVVLGGGSNVEALCTGGFFLKDTKFTSQRLAELAKMDGAIVLNQDGDKVLRANVHLIPDSSIPTLETGTRHRTAERFAMQTHVTVVSVSEGRKMAVLFTSEGRLELESPAELLPRANQLIQTLDRFRRQFDVHIQLLTKREVTDVATYGTVAAIIQRAEIIRRLGSDIEDLSIALGEEGSLIQFQADDLLHGVHEIANLVIKDYVRGRARRRTLKHIRNFSIADLHDPEAIATAYGFGDLEAEAKAAGYRLLEQIPGLPTAVKKALVTRFRNVPRMLRASVDDFSEVEGVGPSRAPQLQVFFAQLRDEAGLVAEES